MLNKMNVIAMKHYDVIYTIMGAYVAGGTTMVAIVVLHNVVTMAVRTLKQQQFAY